MESQGLEFAAVIEKLEISESHHLLWDRVMDDRAIQNGRESRILANFLKELGGTLTGGWSWDGESRVFYRVTHEPTTDTRTAEGGSQGVG